MAQFQNIITTVKGRALIAKMIAGAEGVTFKNIQTSSAFFSPGQLPYLGEITPVNQTTLVSRVTRTNDVAVRIEGAINNTMLTQSYNCNSVGITAIDPDEGEILFGVTIVDLSIPENSPDFIPAFNGVTSTGILFDLVLTVDNSDSISDQVDPAAVATIRQLNEVIKEIETIKMSIGGGGLADHIADKDVHTTAKWKNDVQQIVNEIAMQQASQIKSMQGTIDELRGTIDHILKNLDIISPGGTPDKPTVVLDGVLNGGYFGEEYTGEPVDGGGFDEEDRHITYDGGEFSVDYKEPSEAGEPEVVVKIIDGGTF